ncbi:cAMP-activated global transcriptional regulator CRP [Pelagibaculum spongiae]|uniref:cAMP-activated global transcriptional regulator CRP n=1 Tax=Pelagibaculum spongiae TaxID=2080658 RepID=A0A2V1GUN5_9GAMM|nr:cAMP-activated global transcriptional regulator CRP [Pelagibaculum spongiae]PVZ67750.1 cAMP-activated global transcriptional regulator CRP [Pelagibaculum spongiae]
MLFQPPAPDETIEKFLKNCHRKQYPPKTTIICAGDEPDTLYYIIRGSVSVMMEENDGREIILTYLSQGNFFGEMGFFESSDGRSAWIKARTECLVAEISYTRFRQLVNEDPSILFRLSSQMALRLKKTSQKVSDLAFVDVTGRVAATLMELCKEPDAMTHPEGMQIKVTRQELGRIVGCSREMVGRVIRELEDRGLITAKGKTMVVYGTR